MKRLDLRPFWLAIALAACASPATAEAPYISRLSTIDREFMAQQRQRVDELARVHLGRYIRRQKAYDLSTLQNLLERRAVRPDQTLELQAMGMVLGDLLAQELNMQWVVYEDKYGRSRALQLGEAEIFLFPVTMISRRYEVGAETDVRTIYQKALDTMAPYQRPLPFQ